jgi:hypothetical protein
MERNVSMKKKMDGVLMSMFLVSFLYSAPFAYSSDTKMDHSTHTGKRIHESHVQDFRLAYHLLELPGNNYHHLMVYIIDGQGNYVTEGKVGYLIEGPGGSKQKVMAESMGTAFGGNVNFNKSGNYIVRTKAVFDDVKILDKFTFEIK